MLSVLAIIRFTAGMREALMSGVIKVKVVGGMPGVDPSGRSK